MLFTCVDTLKSKAENKNVFGPTALNRATHMPKDLQAQDQESLEV